MTLLVGVSLGFLGAPMISKLVHPFIARTFYLPRAKAVDIIHCDSNQHPNQRQLNESKDRNNQDSDAWRVLHSSLELFAKRMKLHSRKQGLSNCDRNRKVVNYLSPEQVMKQLFQDGRLSNDSSTKSFSVDLSNEQDGLQLLTDESDRCDQMLEFFNIIHEHSVDTSHRYFFNQLWGSLDPIALAAEIIALCANTSVATFEIAPVFTMIEKEVLEKLGRIIFGSNSYEEKDYSHDMEATYDGQMQPGGSLSNLTALHVARHYFKAISGHQQLEIKNTCIDSDCEFSEEKKEQSIDGTSIHSLRHSQKLEPTMVAFVSSEAHYSFTKSMSVAGLDSENLIIVPTLPNGQMNVDQLDFLMSNVENEAFTNRIPFFVGLTAGSTVRGSFDDIEAVVRICRKHEKRLDFLHGNQQSNNQRKRHKIWMHVDGAWGGPAVFSSRSCIRDLLKGVEQVDSFTINLHKMLGAPQQTTAFVTRHKGILQSCNSTRAKYLFDFRKHGAQCDLGDASFQCGRRTDAIKFWALWKYYGSNGLGKKVEEKVDALKRFAVTVREHESFMLACEPWPFNVNFFYLPKRIRQSLKELGIDSRQCNPSLPDSISTELAKVSVKLKLRLHESGTMLIPFQPLSNQKADCFRLVIAGNKHFDDNDIYNIMDIMEKYGSDL